MRLGVVQMFINDTIKANTASILRFTEKAALNGIELAVFPEMCLTGYHPQTLRCPGFNEELARALAKISEQATKLAIGLIIGGASFLGSKLFNTAYVILPEGTTYLYYKNYLTDLEKKYFTPGTQPLHFTFKERHFGVIICRDQNYPELARNSCPEQTSALCILSAHYYNPQEARWKLAKNQALPIARAVENHCYVLLANTVGSHLGFVSLGNSLIADPEGALVVLGDEASELILSCDLAQK